MATRSSSGSHKVDGSCSENTTPSILTMKKTIEFDGVIYTEQSKGYYTASRGGKIVTLHNAVWTAANGPVPPKHLIHHRDENPANNALSNLQCVSSQEHNRLHERDFGSTAYRNARRKLAAEIRWAAQTSSGRPCSACGVIFYAVWGKRKTCSPACYKDIMNRRGGRTPEYVGDVKSRSLEPKKPRRSPGKTRRKYDRVKPLKPTPPR